MYFLINTMYLPQKIKLIVDNFRYIKPWRFESPRFFKLLVVSF